MVPRNASNESTTGSGWSVQRRWACTYRTTREVIVEASSGPSASSCKTRAAACTRVIPLPGVRRKESRELLGSFFRCRRDKFASTSSTGSAHKRAKESLAGALGNLTVPDGEASCADAGEYETMFWLMSSIGAGSRHEIGYADIVRGVCIADNTRPEGYNRVCDAFRRGGEQCFMQLAKLRWLGRGKYVELTLHCSAKAIMRHTWLGICVCLSPHATKLMSAGKLG
jgi:hypothetical protein